MPCEWPESFFFCPANPAYMNECACLSDRDSTEKFFLSSHTAGGSAAAEGIRRKKPAAAGWYTEFVVQ